MVTGELARWLLQQRPTTGQGKQTNCLDILCNADLVAQGVRLSFMVQPIDYKPKTFGQQIVQRLADAGFAHRAINQGIVIFLPANAGKVNSILDTYERRQDESALGRALSYPAADDFTDMNEPERMFMDWMCRFEDLEGQIMGNVFTNPKYMIEGHRLGVRMAQALVPKGVQVEFQVSAAWGE